MANAGKRLDPVTGKVGGTNGSQFFISVGATEWLNGKHTIFGKVADDASRAVVDKIAHARVSGPATVRSRTSSSSRSTSRTETTISETLPDGAQAAPPVCPRHPDRVSYVRCQRCGRPTCPDCQRPAAVGIQCVDCVAEAARALPTTRTALGGVVRPGRPVVTLTLIGLCVASFVLQLVVPDWTARWIFSPFAGYYEPWRFLTVAFLHSTTNYLHIVFNMVALWFVGPMLEQTLGRVALPDPVPAQRRRRLGRVGAPRHGRCPRWRSSASVRPARCSGCSGRRSSSPTGSAATTAGIISLIVVNFAIGFVATGIAWQAHLGGLVTGARARGGLRVRARRSAGRSSRSSRPPSWRAVLFVAAVLKYRSFGLFF